MRKRNAMDSDPAWIYAALGAMIALAVVAGWADRRRMRRADADAVGWMPWRAVAFWSCAGVLVLAGLAMRLSGAS
ncbi:hypothetical protein GTZ99_04040 [Novosphingobium sp. FSY-8]|uniref:Secreted protein with PEP-CTERM sorting signal n=1 Tax=Novosphingobium ovatum TaxID=1908523 RepID=A0ABW9XB29_9SPHN|nr:hypothetical protein [Novosphingobium ovatum]NBC35724.1 hypothetical protein [Novosphingobium ovatum]